MRGKILQYNGTDGTGVITAEGQQYNFAIAAWKGTTAPAVGKTVDVVLAEGRVQSVTLVGDDVLLREKTAELTGKLGGFVSEFRKGDGSGLGGSIVAKYGLPLLVAHGVFFIATIFFHMISMGMLGGVSMFDLASGGMGAGGVKLLLLLAYVSITVPFFWPDRRAWLALLLPLLSVLWAYWAIHELPMSGLAVGFWLALIAAVVLAVGGFQRYKRVT